MSDESRPVRGVAFFGLLLLLGSVAATAWWLNRPGPAGPPPGTAAAEQDVYCTGRVDAAGRVSGLDPAQPGRVTEVLAEEGAAVRKGQELLRFDPAVAQARLVQADAAAEAARIELDVAKRDKARFPDQIAARTNGVSDRVIREMVNSNSRPATTATTVVPAPQTVVYQPQPVVVAPPPYYPPYGYYRPYRYGWGPPPGPAIGVVIR
jgi:multidrug efflux pump subunit AcrA (membrane-fusion protein)